MAAEVISNVHTDFNLNRSYLNEIHSVGVWRQKVSHKINFRLIDFTDLLLTDRAVKFCEVILPVLKKSTPKSVKGISAPRQIGQA